MDVNADLLRGFCAARTFKEGYGSIDALDFHRSGDVLVSSSSDESIRIFDAAGGTPRGVLHSRKYGASTVRFAPDPNAVLYGSTKGDWALRLHDITTNSYIRYLQGHSEPIFELSVSPIDQGVLSSSFDGTARLWDLRAVSAIARLAAPPATRVAASFDEQGLVFASLEGPAAPGPPGGGMGGGLLAPGPASSFSSAGHLRLYDSRGYSQGPFATFTVPACAEEAPLPSRENGAEEEEQQQQRSPHSNGGPSTTSPTPQARAAPLGWLRGLEEPAPALGLASDAARAAALGNPLLPAAASPVAPTPPYVLFSPDGSKVLTLLDGSLTVLDSFEGKVLLSTRVAERGAPSRQAAFSPDGSVVLVGCADGTVRGWKVRDPDADAEGGNGGGADAAAPPSTPTPAFALPAFALDNRGGEPRAIAFSPRKALFASACTAVNLWVPTRTAVKSTAAA